MERIVSRSELRSRSTTPSTSPEPVTDEVLRHLEHINIAAPQVAKKASAGDDGHESDDAELDFRLFRTHKPTGEAAAHTDDEVRKIKLHSESIDSINAGFLEPQRNQSYYFANAASHIEEQKYQAAAMSAEQILKLAELPWPGCAYPWKVLSLPRSGLHDSIRQQELKSFEKLVGGVDATRRKRPGKKYRIRLRSKHAASQARKEAVETAAAEREVAEREKRNRRNREKKVKKRARDRAKKAADVAAA